MAELHAGVFGGELPIDLTLVGVGGGLPDGEFAVEDFEVADTAIQALPCQRGEFDLGDVEPGAVLWGVVDLESLGECVGFGGWECLVERGDAVGVEVVHHQHDDLRVGVVDGEQFLHLSGPVDAGPLGQGVDPAPPGQGLDPHEDRAGAVSDVFGVLPQVLPWFGQAFPSSRMFSCAVCVLNFAKLIIRG